MTVAANYHDLENLAAGAFAVDERGKQAEPLIALAVPRMTYAPSTP